MPVFPEVASTTVPPGFKIPSRSAASIIEMPIRSLTEYPGFKLSILANTCAFTSLASRLSFTKGVFPISPRMFCWNSIRVSDMPDKWDLYKYQKVWSGANCEGGKEFHAKAQSRKESPSLDELLFFAALRLCVKRSVNC